MAESGASKEQLIETEECQFPFFLKFPTLWPRLDHELASDFPKVGLRKRIFFPVLIPNVLTSPSPSTEDSATNRRGHEKNVLHRSLWLAASQSDNAFLCSLPSAILEDR